MQETTPKKNSDAGLVFGEEELSTIHDAACKYVAAVVNISSTEVIGTF